MTAIHERESEEAQLVYGLKGGQLVHVRDVDRGAECGCICPYCEGPLVARRGDVRAAHFAHYRQAACAWAKETALHLLAKQILRSTSEVQLPAVKSRYRDRELAPAFLLRYSNVRVEQRFHEIIPDLIVETAHGDLLIEVFVTHKVHEEKAQKIRNQRVRAIEVDVRHLRFELDPEVVRREIIHSTDRKRWIYTSEFDQDVPPPPPTYRSLPATQEVSSAATAESADLVEDQKKRDAELFASYKPPEPFVFPRRLSDKIRAQYMGQEPSRCIMCGSLTTSWARINCETGECVCRSCTSRR